MAKTDANGNLLNSNSLIANGVISEEATILISAEVKKLILTSKEWAFILLLLYRLAGWL